MNRKENKINNDTDNRELLTKFSYIIAVAFHNTGPVPLLYSYGRTPTAGIQNIPRFLTLSSGSTLEFKDGKLDATCP